MNYFRKTIFASVAAFTVLSVNATLAEQDNFLSNNIVEAKSSKKLLTHNAAIYNKSGKRTGKKTLKKGKKVTILSSKTIKGKKYYRVGKNKYIKVSNFKKAKAHNAATKTQAQQYKAKVKKGLVYNTDNVQIPNAADVISNSSDLPSGTTYSWSKRLKLNFDAADSYTNSDNSTPVNGSNYATGQLKYAFGKVKVTYPDGSIKNVKVKFNVYGTNKIKIPSGYTAKDVLNYGKGYNPSKSLIKSSKVGAKTNRFVSESKKDDNEKVDFNNLTDDQKIRLTQFAIRLINDIRSQMGVTGKAPLTTNADIQKRADKVAADYTEDKWKYSSMAHDALAIDDGFPIMTFGAAEENEMGLRFFTDDGEAPNTMTEMKLLVYDGIHNFLFGGQEWDHAATLVGDDEYYDLSRMAVSFNYSVDGYYVAHYLFVPKPLSEK